jgi:hypothetical protein
MPDFNSKRIGTDVPQTRIEGDLLDLRETLNEIEKRAAHLLMPSFPNQESGKALQPRSHVESEIADLLQFAKSLLERIPQ